MSRPGTRFFVGPLTPSQQRRRQRARDRFREVDEIAYVRNIPMSDAFRAEHYERVNNWMLGYQLSGHPSQECR